MKIEVGESLAFSWLRHVYQCWIVQANWKFSEHWRQYLTDEELDQQFKAMKSRFDRDGGVFKQTKDVKQFLRQGEIDIIGVDDEGVVHAVEVAFHEDGLKYGKNSTETNDRILKKMLRTLLILRAFRPPKTRLNIYSLSPKVRPVVQQLLEKTFATLCDEYHDVKWRFVANDSFADDVAEPTLRKAVEVADSSELFVRSAKLLKLIGYGVGQRPGAQRTRSNERQSSTVREFQPLVRNLMQTLLVDAPELLSDDAKRGLQAKEYCQELGLKMSLPLLRKVDCGPKVNGRNRYWTSSFGEFYVCSQWSYHSHNARKLLDFVEELTVRNEGRRGTEILQRHAEAFRGYIEGA